MWRGLFWLNIFVLCSCSTVQQEQAKESARPLLPSAVSFNRDAGHGNSLFVMLRLVDGTELPFLVDTGCSVTIFDHSLEWKLGNRLRTEKIDYGWLGKRKVSLHSAPRLFLGNTQLMSGDQVWVDDLSQTSHPNGAPLMGILGMDCLRHYCIELDFVNRAMRFLDPDRLDRTNLGCPFPLTKRRDQFFVQENLIGVKGVKTMIDTADYDDGALEKKLFEREVREQKSVAMRLWKTASGKIAGDACFPHGSFGGQTYSNVVLEDCSRSSDPCMNIIGLRFLARHLVTFNFPKAIMYLKRTKREELNEWTGSDSNYGLMMEAGNFLSSLKIAGQLPGWKMEQTGIISLLANSKESQTTYPISGTFRTTKTTDPFQYNYTVVRNSEKEPWKLQKAWRSDGNGHVVQQYSVP